MKEKNAKAATEKGQVTHKGKPIRLAADRSVETLQARKEWGPIFNIIKEKDFQPRISYLAKLSFISEGEIKSFTDKQLLTDFVTTRPALQAPEGSIIYRKEQPVLAFLKIYQKVKSINIKKNLHQWMDKIAS